jgi:hypothetical protein
MAYLSQCRTIGTNNGGQMYEAVIWDIRDKDSADPSSTLGTFDTQADASVAIFEHLDRHPEQRPFIVKTEAVEQEPGGLWKR